MHRFKFTPSGDSPSKLRGSPRSGRQGHHKADAIAQSDRCPGGKSVPVTHLTDTLWPDSDRDQAINSFHTTLSRLRGAIEIDPFQLQGGRLSLDPRLCWVDTATAGTRIENDTSPPKHAALIAGKTYCYVVTTLAADGESELSPEVSAVPAAKETQPSSSDNPEEGMWVAPVYTGDTAQLKPMVSVDHTGKEIWSAHGWGFCSPGYCDWGKVPASRISTGEIQAIWNFGWKTTTIKANMSTVQPGWLEAYVVHDYSEEDGRTDRYHNDIFKPAN